MPEEGNHHMTESTGQKGVKNMDYNYFSKQYSQNATRVRKGTYGDYTHIYSHKISLTDDTTN